MILFAEIQLKRFFLFFHGVDIQQGTTRLRTTRLSGGFFWRIPMGIATKNVCFAFLVKMSHRTQKCTGLKKYSKILISEDPLGCIVVHVDEPVMCV